MVKDGVSPKRIRRYLHLWGAWWVRTSESWQYQELFEWFLNVCWDRNPAAYAAGLLHQAIKKTIQEPGSDLSARDFQAIA